MFSLSVRPRAFFDGLRNPLIAVVQSLLRGFHFLWFSLKWGDANFPAVAASNGEASISKGLWAKLFGRRPLGRNKTRRAKGLVRQGQRLIARNLNKNRSALPYSLISFSPNLFQVATSRSDKAFDGLAKVRLCR
jgi:hypothetical protein